VTEATELDRLKDEFIRVIAHELKTPITIMKGYANTLAQTLGPTLAPAHVRMLQAIDRGADRINRIMCELLDAQQIDLGLFELTIERVDLLELVHEVVDRLAARFPQRTLRLREAQPMVLRADGERLREVLRILLDNAIRYSPGGGDVEVSLQRLDGSATLSVRDHGVGIPADRREHMFDRFYRAHTGTPHDYGGTGLGLYVAQAIVARHGGTMGCDSVEGQGTTFTVRLPLTDGQ